MTDHIAIPKRKGKQRLLPASYDATQSTTGTSDYSPVSSTASYNNSPKTPAPLSDGQQPSPSTAKDKEVISASVEVVGVKQKRSGHERRVSLLSESCRDSNSAEGHTWLMTYKTGESLSRSEHTVINVGDDDRPRLITCVRSSQGFDWNQDIFLPSYMTDHDYQAELERRPDPVEDIFVTDEEAAEIFPN